MSKNKGTKKQTPPAPQATPVAPVAQVAQAVPVAQVAPAAPVAQVAQVAPVAPAGYMRRACGNLHIDIIYQQAAWLGEDWQNKDRLGALVARAAYAAFIASKRQIDPACQYELGVRLSDDAELCRLNAKWRNQNKPTNVLAFATDEWRAARTGIDRHTVSPCMLGDIVLARETIIREAQASGGARFAHVQHLIVHGVLHLLGYDHIAPQEALVMESLEREILSDLDNVSSKKPLFNKTLTKRAAPHANGENPHAPI